MLAVTALTACEQDLDNDSGPRVVENNLASSWQTTGEWTLKEDLRLSGPPGGYFGVIGALAADSRHNIHVLDGLAQEIHVFDSEGGFVRTLGGSGEGPGEFRMARGLAVAPGDTLWVVDPMTRRYSLFGPGGDFLRVRAPPRQRWRARRSGAASPRTAAISIG